MHTRVCKSMLLTWRFSRPIPRCNLAPVTPPSSCMRYSVLRQSGLTPLWAPIFDRAHAFVKGIHNESLYTIVWDSQSLAAYFPVSYTDNGSTDLDRKR